MGSMTASIHRITSQRLSSCNERFVAKATSYHTHDRFDPPHLRTNPPRATGYAILHLETSPQAVPLQHLTQLSISNTPTLNRRVSQDFVLFLAISRL
jgi:hypothetical protein